jgi:uncharacterized protein YajQ (UPF0234 family)
MPSFDIVSEVDNHEVTNAIDQANREINTRFDFKDSGAQYEYSNDVITLTAPSDFQVNQMVDILENKWIKRNLDVQSFDKGEVDANLATAKMDIKLKTGIDKETAKKLTKFIKESKVKVQASIQGEQVRVNGKKRDDLQAVMQLIKDNNFTLPLQFTNFRD